MATSLVDLDLDKLEFPCILEWIGGRASNFTKSRVEFTGPGVGTVIEKGYPDNWGEVGHHSSSWFWASDCWKLAETSYDPLQNGDTEDDI